MLLGLTGVCCALHNFVELRPCMYNVYLCTTPEEIMHQTFMHKFTHTNTHKHSPDKSTLTQAHTHTNIHRQPKNFLVLQKQCLTVFKCIPFFNLAGLMQNDIKNLILLQNVLKYAFQHYSYSIICVNLSVCVCDEQDLLSCYVIQVSNITSKLKSNYVDITSIITTFY